ncbi:MAG TPA: hypothetical protein VH592_05540 [Gemmataceae bacterium]|jgi:hypothetical protein
MFARSVFSVLFVVVLATAPLVGEDKKPHEKEAGTNTRFERFKRLAGEWVGNEQGKEGHEVRVQYKVTSGGSAVVETIAPGTEHEMVSVIHPDGADLILTHYCMLGNQPQMKASGGGHGNKIEFKFVRATNMKSDKDMHMHDATFTFVDQDTLTSEWTAYTGGKAAEHAVFKLKRKK